MLKIYTCVVKGMYYLILDAIFVIDQHLIAVRKLREENSTEQRQHYCLAPETRDMTVSLDEILLE
jgi:hypothetical protein